MHPPYRGLAFLISIGSLPIACTTGDGESDTKTSDPTGDTTGGASESSTGGSATTGTSTTGTPTTGTSTDGGSGGTSGEPTGGNTSEGFITTATASTDDPTEGDTESFPPVTDPTCLAYAAKLVECFPRGEMYRQMYAYYCQYYKTHGLRIDGQVCADAVEVLYVCFSMLTCAELESDSMPPCEEEAAAIMQACPKLFKDGTSDTEGDNSGGSSSTG